MARAFKRLIFTLMSMISRYDPRGGIADFWQEFRKPTPYRWPVLAVSMLMTGSLIWLFTHETVYNEPERPEVTFITTLPPGRTDAEITARNAENQRVQDALARLDEQREEERKALYRSLGRATGLDVDAMEAEIRAEEAAEAARAAQEGAPQAADAAPR